jgi:hypothetical protein
MKNTGFLGIKKLIDTHKRCRSDRKEYRIKPVVAFEVDDDYYLMSLLPTIYWQPWPFRYPDNSVLDIHWLNIHICIGLWTKREKKEN